MNLEERKRKYEGKIRGFIKFLLPKKVVEYLTYRNVKRNLKRLEKTEDFEKVYPEVRNIKNFIENPTTIFDIGANRGTISFYLSKKFPNATIHAFEPGDRAYNILKKIIKKFKLHNVITHKIGLGEKRKIFGMKMLREDDTTAFVTEKSKNKFNMQKLDDFVKENKIRKIDFIKIDVEGYERYVLGGGAKSLKKFKPIILMEVDDTTQKRFGHSLKELLDFMNRLGYSKIPQTKLDSLFLPRGSKDKNEKYIGRDYGNLKMGK